MKLDTSATPPEPESHTPFDAAPAVPSAQLSVQEAQAQLEAKMALLPDYGDEAFPRAGKKPSTKAARPKSPRRAGAPSEEDDEVAAPLSVLVGGFLGGVAGNIALGFALLALRSVGADLYGPGVLAMVVALVVLALVLGSWPRRAWIMAAGFLAGLVLSFGAVFLFVGPRMDAVARPPAAEPIDIPVPSEAEAGGPQS